MRRCLIAIVSAGLVLLWIAVRPGDVPSRAWSSPAAERTGGKESRPPAKPAPDPREKVPNPKPHGLEDEDWAPRHTTKPLTEEQEQEALDYLKQKRPELHQQLMEQREKDPRRFRSTLRTLWHFASRMKSLPEEVRNAYEARQAVYVRAWRLARQYQAADTPAAKAEAEKQLIEAAGEQFEADQIIRKHRLEQLAEQIKQLEQELQDRARDREAVVRDIVDRMKKSAERYEERGEDRKPADQPTVQPEAPDKKGQPRKVEGPREKPGPK